MNAVEIEEAVSTLALQPFDPAEFLVPLHVIDEAVERVRDGTITEVVYDPKSARLMRL